MSSHATVGGRGHVVLAVCLWLIAGAAAAQSRQGTAISSPNLAGTSWQLVKFQGSDGSTLTPEDRSKYTIAFGAYEQLTARVDCNRGRGRWKSSGSSQLQVGQLALTGAACRPGSLHDQIVKQWPSIRSYVVRDGHLFLVLMADGGIYEFEPRVSGPVIVPDF
jgi:para-nitrobenzyl esterase